MVSPLRHLWQVASTNIHLAPLLLKVQIHPDALHIFQCPCIRFASAHSDVRSVDDLAHVVGRWFQKQALPNNGTNCSGIDKVGLQVKSYGFHGLRSALKCELMDYLT